MREHTPSVKMKIFKWESKIKLDCNNIQRRNPKIKLVNLRRHGIQMQVPKKSVKYR